MTKNFIEELQNYYELKDNDEFKLQDKHGAIFGANSIFTFHNEVLRCTGHSGQRQEGFIGLLRGKLTPTQVQKYINAEKLQEILNADSEKAGGNNMSKNYIEQFMKDNGLEVHTYFKICQDNGRYYIDEDFSLMSETTDNGLDCACDSLLVQLLIGNEKVAKEPPKPWTLEEIESDDNSETFYYLNFEGRVVYRYFYTRDAADIAFIKQGLAFKTEQDALDNIDKFKEFWGDQWEGEE